MSNEEKLDIYYEFVNGLYTLVFLAVLIAGIVAGWC